MRLPQDRILHIDTELAGDEVRIVAEWQGELVRCKDCEHHFYDVGNQAWFCHEHEYGEIFNDDDFCSWAKMKGGAE